MNTDVQKLVEVDREACRKKSEAQEYYDKTLREIQAEKQKLQESYNQKASLRVQEVKDAESAALEASYNQVKKRYAEKESSLYSAWNENFERWVTQLTDKCLGR